MEFVIIGIIAFMAIWILAYIFDYNKKVLQQLGHDEELDKLAEVYPSNIEMCQDYLKILGNEKVKIEENKDTQASLYIVTTDKISIANIQNSYTRIQTIAHECLHSVQSRKLLLFNFAFSNIYIIYFILICILLIYKVLPNKMMFLVIFFIFSMIYYTIRVFLENDAMIKARYLAKEYMEEKKISSPKEIKKLIDEFDRINAIGIKCINYQFFRGIMIKLLLLSILCFLF